MLQLLLIEDDPIMGESLLDRFELEGFGVHWSRTVAQAALLLDHRAFDAVVSDVRLADGSGERLFEHRQRTGAALPPWLFITAFASVDRAVAMLQAGARDYVTKPFDIAELVCKVRTAVGAPDDSPPKVGVAADGHGLGMSAAMRLLASQAMRVAARAHRADHG